MGVTYPIGFQIHGGTPAVAFSALVAEGGALTVDLLTAASLPQNPPVRLGSFAGRLSRSVADSLAAWAASASFLPENAMLAPGAVLRQLSVGDGASRYVSPDSLDPLLESALADAAKDALAHPVSAVEIGVAEGNLAIRGLGTAPISLLLLDPDTPGYWARVWRDDETADGGRRFLAPDQLGPVPVGVFDLAPGDGIALPLPPGATPTGGFMCWRAGPGPARSILSGPWLDHPAG
ncbi:hypothetical protein [Fodinicola acaciae]|uniref:hypothetical protein n=1 Tax=Fodinicola acaciae TaxID=2681555 RepID=UPI0013D2F218|nr:hypothetical protein [Fodinicola acaciae]